MNGSGFRAATVSWEGYYSAIEGRSLRRLFLDAVARLPEPDGAGEARVAIDLGCGDGKETLALLERGWTVIAVDSAPEAIERLAGSVRPQDASRLTTHVAPFHELELPQADFVYAGLSLPFCDPEQFPQAWSRATAAVRPGGLFAGHFFGTNDSWAGAPDMTFQSREQLDALLAPFDIIQIAEQDEAGPAVNGPKHWHVFHVIVKKG